MSASPWARASPGERGPGLQAPEPLPGKTEPRRSFVMKDVRVFLNSLSHGLDLMKQGGIAAGMRREETDDALILTISIPKTRAPT